MSNGQFPSFKAGGREKWSSSPLGIGSWGVGAQPGPSQGQGQVFREARQVPQGTISMGALQNGMNLAEDLHAHCYLQQHCCGWSTNSHHFLPISLWHCPYQRGGNYARIRQTESSGQPSVLLRITSVCRSTRVSSSSPQA